MEWVKWSLNWWYVLYLQIKLINCSLLKATLNVVWGVVAGKTFLYDDGKLRLFFYDKRKTKHKKNINSEISFVIALFIIWVYNVHSNSLLQKTFQFSRDWTPTRIFGRLFEIRQPASERTFDTAPMVCHASEGCKRLPAPQCFYEHHHDAQKQKKSKFKLNSKGSLNQRLKDKSNGWHTEVAWV